MIDPSLRSDISPKTLADQPETSRTVLMVSNFILSSDSYGCVSHELASRLESIGWGVLRTSYQKGRLSKLTDMLLTTWLRRCHYAVAYVEVYSGQAFIWAQAVCLVLRVVRKPFVLALHGGNLPLFFDRRRLIGRRFLHSAAAVVCPSSYLQRSFHEWRPDVRVFSNGLDVAQYPQRVRVRASARIMWLRAFREMYSPETAVEVLAALLKEFPAAKLTMIGPDRNDGTLKRTLDMAASLNVLDHLEVIPGVPKTQVGTYLDRGDVFLNTSTIDNTPVSVIEAMACGLCIVSTNVGGLGQLLTDEGDALLVGPRKPSEMALAVNRILTEESLSQRLSANAIEKAKTFDWSRVLPMWDDLLTGVQRHGHLNTPSFEYAGD